MSIFNFFKKKKRGYKATYRKFEKFLEENSLIDISGRLIHHKEMVDSFLPNTDKNEAPIYYNFKETFKEIEAKQQVCFQKMVDSNFSQELVEAFFTNYQNTISASYSLPSTNILFISYWKMIIEKVKIEFSMLGSTINQELSEAFFVSFERITNEEFKRLTTPPST